MTYFSERGTSAVLPLPLLPALLRALLLGAARVDPVHEPAAVARRPDEVADLPVLPPRGEGAHLQVGAAVLGAVVRVVGKRQLPGPRVHVPAEEEEKKREMLCCGTPG